MADFDLAIKTVTEYMDLFRGAEIARIGADINAQNIILGGQIAASGAELTASGLRSQKPTVKSAARFNQDIDYLNTSRQISNLSSQARKLISRQIVTAAGTGLDPASKSFQLLRNEALDEFSTRFQNIRIDAENRRLARNFQTDLSITNLENRARAEDYRAATERSISQSRAAAVRYEGEISAYRATRQATKQLPTLIGSIFGDLNGTDN